MWNVGQAQQNSNLICNTSRQIHIPNIKWSQKTAEKSLENLILAKSSKLTHVKVGQAWQNLICITSRQIHIPDFKSISQKMAEKTRMGLS